MMINVAIVGLGYWGPNLLRTFTALPQCRVLYCCDKDGSRLTQVSRSFPTVKLTKSMQTVLADKRVDAVVIATPSDTHAKLATLALKANKHVLVEKPLTLSTTDGQAMVNLGKTKNKLVMVGHTYEYHPAITAIKKYLDQRKLGRLLYIYSNRVNLGKVREETNALWNLAPHDFSILNYLIGSKPRRVSAFGRDYLQSKREDVVWVNLEFGHRLIAHIQVSWLDPRKQRQLTMVGSKRMLIFDDMDNEAPVRIYDKGFVPLVDKRGQRLFGEFHLRLRPGDIRLPYIESKEPLLEECAHFIDCIINRRSPRSDGDNGLAVVQVLAAAQQSLDQGGKWIDIPPSAKK